jgi:two-component system cell cycle response regulator DivK
VNAFNGSVFELVAPTPRPVLLVNGDIDSRSIYRMALAEAGIEVITVGDSSSGLRVARITQPKVIVLDVPAVRDGFDAATRMRADAALRDTTMIALADQALPAHQRALIEAEFDRVLLKPIEPSAVLAAVRQGLTWRPTDAAVSAD